MGGWASKEVRIVLLGKTGDGKSSSGNTIFGEKIFICDSSPNSVTKKCEAKVKTIDGNKITLVDTPGFCDPNHSDEELKPAIVKCITECAPGPHAFVIVLRVARYSKQEMEVVQKITESFGEGVLKYATVLFTHGNDLIEGQTIEEFVEQSPKLKELVEKCGGGCHVIDNTHWNPNQQDEYRSNRVQVEKLLNTIEEMVRKNRCGYYTNEMLKLAEEDLQAEHEIIRKEKKGELSEEKMREEAKERVSKKYLIKFAGVATGTLLGALLGITMAVSVVIIVGLGLLKLGKSQLAEIAAVSALTMEAGAAGAGAGAGATIGVGANVGIAVLGVSALAGAVGGGIVGAVGAEAADGAETVFEAVKKAATANYENAMAALKCIKEIESEAKNINLFEKLLK